MKKMLTVKQVSEAAQLDPRLVLREIKDGHLYGLQVGRVWRIPEEAYDKWIYQGVKK